MSEYNFKPNYSGIFDKKTNYIIMPEELGEIFNRAGLGGVILTPNGKHKKETRQMDGKTILLEAGYNSVILFPTIDELVEHGGAGRLRYIFHIHDHYAFLGESKQEFRLPRYFWEHAEDFGEEIKLVKCEGDFLEIADAEKLDYFHNMFPLTNEDFEELSQLGRPFYDVSYPRIRLNPRPA
jgi:hypothetical protein